MKLKVEFSISPYCIPGLSPAKKGLTIHIIESCVLDHYNSNDENTRKILRSKTRKRCYVDMRHMVFYFCYLYLKHVSTQQIGIEFNRDHATAIHGMKKIRDVSQVDLNMERLVRSISNNLESRISPVIKKENVNDQKLFGFTRNRKTKQKP